MNNLLEAVRLKNLLMPICTFVTQVNIDVT